MKLTGHKTASVYRRYAVTAEADLRAALSRAQQTIAGQLASPGVVELRAVHEGTRSSGSQ